MKITKTLTLPAFSGLCLCISVCACMSFSKTLTRLDAGI